MCVHLNLKSEGRIHSTFRFPTLDEISDRVSTLVLNTIFLLGDIVNFFKFGSLELGLKTAFCIPGFDVLNGFAGVVGGGIMTSMGLKETKEARLTDDTAGIWSGRMFSLAGVMVVALSVFKLGYAVLGMIAFFVVVAPVVTVLIALFGTLNGIATHFMFLFYVVRCGICESEVRRFNKEFRKVLSEVVVACGGSVDGKPLLEERPGFEWWMRSLDEMYAAALEASGVDKDVVFAQLVVGKLERLREVENFDKLITRATKEDCVQEILREEGLKPAEGADAKAALDHLFAKGAERKRWNRALLVVSVVAMGILGFLMFAHPGLMMTLALGAVIGLFVVFMVAFDGPGVKASLNEKKPGQWDGAIFMASTMLLVGLTVSMIAVTVATGGVPLVYALVVGSILLGLHGLALAWVARRNAVTEGLEEFEDVEFPHELTNEEIMGVIKSGT